MGIFVTIVWVLLWAIFIAFMIGFIMSWIDPTRRFGITRIAFDITEPIVAPIRSIVPPIGIFDLSYLIAIILVQVLIRLVEGVR
jgi:YggT family protein